MIGSNQAIYRTISNESNLPFYLKAWWLDATCGDENWDAAIAYDNGNNRITGIMPYHKVRLLGVPYIKQPPFSAYSGPFLFFPDNLDFKHVSKLSFEKKTMEALIQQLPSVPWFTQHFRPEITNWLPFYWNGFQQTTRYTYRLLPDAVTDQQLYENLKNTLRTDLRKARNQVVVTLENEPQLLHQLYRTSADRKSYKVGSLAMFERIYHALALRDQSWCFVARDMKTGAPHAAALVAVDNQSAHLLMAGVAPQFKSSNAIFAIIWESIIKARKNGLIYDFEGSMDQGLEHAFRGFGGVLTPYFRVTRKKLIW